MASVKVMEQPSAVYTQTREIAPAMAAAESSSFDLIRYLVHELRQPLSVIDSAAFLSQLILDRPEPRVQEQLERIQVMVQQISGSLTDLACGQPLERYAEPLSLSHIMGDAMVRLGGGNVTWAAPAPVVVVRLTPAQAALLARCVLGVMASVSGSGPVTVQLRNESGAAMLECSAEVLEPAATPVPGEVSAAMAVVRRIAEANGGAARIEPHSGCTVTLRVTLPSC